MIKPRAAHQTQGMPGPGNGNMLSTGPATIDKPILEHKCIKGQSSGHISYSHAPFPCWKGRTHLIQAAQVLHSWSIPFKQAHPVGNGETMVFADSSSPLSPLIPQCTTNSLFLPCFPLTSAFLSQGRSVREALGLVSHRQETHPSPSTRVWDLSVLQEKYNTFLSNPFLRAHLPNK